MQSADPAVSVNVSVEELQATIPLAARIGIASRREALPFAGM